MVKFMNKSDKLLKKADRNFSVGMYNQAINQYRQYLETNPEDPNIWVRLAFSCNSIGNFEASIKYSQKALELKSDLISALDNLFYAYDQKEDFDNEIEVLKTFFKNPFYIDALKEVQEENNKDYKDFDFMDLKNFNNTNYFVQEMFFGKPVTIDPRNLKKLKNFNINNYNDFLNAYIKQLNNSLDTLTIKDSIANCIRNKFKYAKINESKKKIVAFKVILENFPIDNGFLKTLADAYKDIADYDHEIEVYKRILELIPNNVNILYDLGIAYVRKNDYNLAIETFNKIFEIKSKKLPEKNLISQNECGIKHTDFSEIIIWYYLGIAYDKISEEEKAIDAYNNAINLFSIEKYGIDPKLTNKNLLKSIWNNLGSVYNKKGEYEKAIEACYKALEINPKYSSSWNYIGAAYYGLGEEKKAIESLNMALKLDPKHVLAWKYLGSIYSDKEDYRNAIESFKKVTEFEPNDPIAWYNLAKSYYNCGDLEKAVYANNRSLQLDNKFSSAIELNKKIKN